MRKFLFLVLMVSLVAGCGDQKTEKSYMGKKVTGADYSAQALESLQKGDVPTAIQNFDQAIRHDPENPQNYLVLAQVYMRLKQFDRAIDTFSGAIKVDPNNGEAYYFTALSYVQQGPEFREPAVKALEKSIEIFIQKKDQEKLQQAANLLKSLTQPQS